jgi:hypothetical protein
MLISSLMKRVLAALLSVCLVTTYSLPAYSGVVTTEQMLQSQLTGLDRDALVSTLQRDDVRRQLIERGVDPDVAADRIAALSDDQIAQIESGIDDLPAGSGIIELLIAVLLVLIILDIVGVTNIFSFIHSPNR